MQLGESLEKAFLCGGFPEWIVQLKGVIWMEYGPGNATVIMGTTWITCESCGYSI